MLKIRLVRTGRKKLPFYRIVAIKSEARRNGKAVAFIGTYDPIAKSHKIDLESAKKFISNGAQPTDTVAYLLRKEGLLSEGESK